MALSKVFIEFKGQSMYVNSISIAQNEKETKYNYHYLILVQRRTLRDLTFEWMIGAVSKGTTKRVREREKE